MPFSAPRRPRSLPLAVAGLSALLAGGVAWAASPASNVRSFGALGSLGAGTAPRGELLAASDGFLYGTASSGGSTGYGAIFRIAADGTVTLVYALGSATTDGIQPYAGLAEGPDGNFYGTTYFGGERSQGTVFKLTRAGTFTTLKSFDGRDGGAFYPYGGLATGPDGALYGTTLRGGTNDAGSVYRIATDGSFSLLHSFGGATGQNPESTLVLGRDGNFWGTTLIGGKNDRGTIFKITPTGTLTVVYEFPPLGAFNAAGVGTNAEGANPRSGLTQGPDGNFYGTTYQGGTGGYGTVFRLTPAGTYTVLRAFQGGPRDGSGPLGAVLVAADGTLYGTTERGGYSSAGTVWRISPAGTYTLLHSFSSLPVDGATPYTGLVAWNGSLVGVSFTDSTTGGGTVYGLQLPDAGNSLPLDLQLSVDSVTLGGSATLSWSAPDQASCTAGGAWSDTISTSGTKVQTPASVGIYNFALGCVDAAGVQRYAFAPLIVNSPPAQTVDGGATGSAGALGGWFLAALAGLAGFRRRRRLQQPAVH